MWNINSRLYDSTSLNVKPSHFGSHAGCPSLTNHLKESDGQGKQVIWKNLMEKAWCQVALLASSSTIIAGPWIWWTREASELKKSDGKGMMSSCSAGLLQHDHCWSMNLMDKGSKWFEKIWWKRHDVKLLCWPRPARSLLVHESDGQGKQVNLKNLMEKAWCQVALLASSSTIIAGPWIWWTREASEFKKSDGKGMMSSCSAGLVQHDHCWSMNLMDKGSRWIEKIWWKRHDVKLLCWPPPAWSLLVHESDGQGKQVIWKNLMEKAWCQVALLASSSTIIAGPWIWWTREASDLKKSDGKGMMSSCSAGLVQHDHCWSMNLMDKGSKWIEKIWWKRHDVNLLCRPRPARSLLVHESDGQGKQVIWKNLMEKAWCQVALLASSSTIIAGPWIWWTREASDLKKSDGKGMMSSCSAGLVQHDHCWSMNLMDKGSKWFEKIWWKRHDVKLLCWPRPARSLLVHESDGQGKQVIWKNLMEKAWCQVALLASSSTIIAGPWIWWTREASDLKKSDGKGMMSSCSAGLVQHDHCWSMNLMDKGSKWFEKIWWKRHDVKLLCWPRPARSLLVHESDGWKVLVFWSFRVNVQGHNMFFLMDINAKSSRRLGCSQSIDGCSSLNLYPEARQRCGR